MKYLLDFSAQKAKLDTQIQRSQDLEVLIEADENEERQLKENLLNLESELDNINKKIMDVGGDNYK